MLEAARRWRFARSAAELGVVAQTLGEVSLCLRHLADTAFELPLVEPAHAAGMSAAATAVAQMERQIEHLLADGDAEEVAPWVTTVDPVDAMAESGDGVERRPWSLHSVVAAPRVRVRGVSSAVVRVDCASRTRELCFAQDAILIGVFGDARLVWTDFGSASCESAVRRHERAFVRRGTEFVVANEGAQPFLGLLVRASGAPDSADVRVPRPR